MRSLFKNPLLIGWAVVMTAALAGPLTCSSHAAGLLVADGGLGGTLEIKEHTVKVVINNGIAVTEVEQVFVNKEDRIVEALYTFPVPKGASIANFSMWISGKEMIGEVVEKERARQIYESYKAVKRDPGLLEQVDYKRFEMRIFPIAARAEQKVKLTYYQELDFDHDAATYVYPLATNTERRANERATNKFAFSLEVKSVIPIIAMESPSHAKDCVFAAHTANYHQASLETNGGDLSRDVVVSFTTERPTTGIDLVTSKSSGEDGYFQLTLTAGKELAEINKGMDYVFVADISGSMAHDGKLGLSRNSMDAFIEALGPDDRFEIITFNVAATPLFRKLEPVQRETQNRAAEFLKAQQAKGGTILRPAIHSAYQYAESDRILNVVILSDGITEQREQQELLQLIPTRPQGSRVFCIGVGNEVNRPLLTQLAERAGGLAAFISREDNLERQAQAFRRKLLRPAATNVQMKLAGADVYDVEPAVIPNLYHGSPVRVYGRYRKSGPATITLKADVLGAPFEDTGELNLPSTDDQNPQLERMWASHRVERLFADERADGFASQRKDEIVRLCEGYSIVSQYASFLVLENDGEYQRWKIQQRNVTRVQRDRVAQEKLRREMDTLRDRAVVKAGPAPSESKEVAFAAPNATPNTSPNFNQLPSNSPSTTTTPAPTRSRDIHFPNVGGGGGGAIDPLTGLVVIGLGGAAWASARRKRKTP